MTSKTNFLLALLASSTLLGQNYLLTTIGGVRPLRPTLPGAPDGDGGPYWDASFSVAWRLTMDRAGNIYIADRTGHRIRRIGTDGIVTTVAGTGVAGYSGDGGPAAAAQLNEPAGVAFDTKGNLYISDSLNARIRKVDLNGIITTFAGTGTAGYSGDGGPVASAQLSIPYNLYFDAQGNLFFIDDQRVRKITPAGTISLFAGNGVNLGCCLPETVPTGDGGPAIDALLHQPSGIAFDAQGNVLIAEVYGEQNPQGRFGRSHLDTLQRLRTGRINVRSGWKFVHQRPIAYQRLLLRERRQNRARRDADRDRRRRLEPGPGMRRSAGG